MKTTIKDNGFDKKGRALKLLLIDGYEYLLIEEKNRSLTSIESANFQNTGMALYGIKKVKK